MDLNCCKLQANFQLLCAKDNLLSLLSAEFSFQAGIILFPVESLGEMRVSPYIISLGDSFFV